MQLKVNELVEKLSDKDYFKFVLSKLEEDPDYLEYSCIKEYRKLEGELTSESASYIIDKLRANKKWQPIAANLLFYSTANTITNDVFSKIMSLRPSLKHICLESLSHCRLSIYQMEAICKMKRYEETFLQLLDIYLHNDCFTAMDLNILLSNNTWAPSFSYAIKEILSSDYGIIDAKKSILKSYC